MLDTIKNILSGNQYPLLKINRQEGYVFRQFIQDTTNVTPQYTSIYKVKFLNIENHPYKVRYYFRLISNDIYTTLNQFFDQYKGKSSAIIQYHHQNFKQAIEEYIGGFYEKIRMQDAPSNLLKEPPSTLDEQQMFVIIAYYAIASLACAYFQYLEQFSMSLPTKNLPETPNDFIYETLQSSFPKEIEIICSKQSTTNDSATEDELNVVPISEDKKQTEGKEQITPITKDTRTDQDFNLRVNRELRVKKLKELNNALIKAMDDNFTGCSQWFYVYKLMAERAIYLNRKYQQFKSDLEEAGVPEKRLPDTSTFTRKYKQIRSGSTYPWKPKENGRSDILEEGNMIAGIAKQVLGL